jgi:hypothetical protein
MSRIILSEYESRFNDDERYADFDLALWPGEVWLTTEPQKMTWLEAIEIAGGHSNIRLPHYSDIICAVERCKESPGLYKLFAPLEEGEFWTICSESYNANQGYACCVTASHVSYESHHKKFEKKWVRFIKRGVAETPKEIHMKKEERDKNIYEEKLHGKTVKILGLDMPEGRADYEVHLQLMSMNGF